MVLCPKMFHKKCWRMDDFMVISSDLTQVFYVWQLCVPTVVNVSWRKKTQKNKL